jgi:hypothetical protein
VPKNRKEKTVKTQDYDILSEIQAEVLGYLEEHPRAADTIEGINKWWLLQRLARYSVTRIQQALDELEIAQVVERRVLCDGREVYAKAGVFETGDSGSTSA